MKLENASAYIKSEITYIIWINCKRYEGFHVVSTWNGLTELENTDGRVVADIPSSFISNFLSPVEIEESEIKIISASHCFFE